MLLIPGVGRPVLKDRNSLLPTTGSRAVLVARPLSYIAAEGHVEEAEADVDAEADGDVDSEEPSVEEEAGPGSSEPQRLASPLPSATLVGRGGQSTHPLAPQITRTAAIGTAQAAARASRPDPYSRHWKVTAGGLFQVAAVPAVGVVYVLFCMPHM